MKNENKYPNGYQPKLDYWLAQHSNLMNAYRRGDYDVDSSSDHECFMDKLEHIKKKIEYFHEKQEEWKFNQWKKEQWIKDWDDTMSLFK